MNIKFFINSQAIGRLGAAAVGYATADRFGLNRTAVATVMIFSATLGTWLGQLNQAAALSRFPDPQAKKDRPKLESKRNFFHIFLCGITHTLTVKTAQIAMKKLGSPLSFIQCAGVIGFYGSVTGWPLGAFISYLFPSTEYK
jgi:hypothetical protein